MRARNVRPFDERTAHGPRVAMNKVEKGGWQDRRAASDWMPCGIRHEVRHAWHLA